MRQYLCYLSLPDKLALPDISYYLSRGRDLIYICIVRKGLTRKSLLMLLVLLIITLVISALISIPFALEVMPGRSNKLANSSSSLANHRCRSQNKD